MVTEIRLNEMPEILIYSSTFLEIFLAQLIVREENEQV